MENWATKPAGISLPGTGDPAAKWRWAEVWEQGAGRLAANL